MNGICAGGTGSFIDQMASLLQTDATGLNEYAKELSVPLYHRGPLRRFCQVRYSAADQRRRYQGRSGRIHFPGGGQPDHQRPGLRKADPRAPWRFWAVRSIFLSELKAAFIRTLNLDDEHIIAPENSHLFAAMGSAMKLQSEKVDCVLKRYESAPDRPASRWSFEVKPVWSRSFANEA